MKSKDLAKRYEIDAVAFAAWLKESNYATKTSMLGGVEIADGHNFDEIVDRFRRDQAVEQERVARLRAEWELAEAQKQQALARMLVTSGFNFDGYTITKYSGYISGDDAVQINRGTSGFFSQATDVGASLMAALVQIRRNALIELKEAAYALGCNAVIGVDFDYLTLDPETANSSGGTTYLPYVFGVTANGNAVVIEKNSRQQVAADAPLATGEASTPVPLAISTTNGGSLASSTAVTESPASPEAGTNSGRSSVAPAGWYQQADGRQCWWDGTRWAEYAI